MSVLRNIGLNLAILAAIGLQVDVAFAQVFSGLQRPAGSSNSVQSPNYFTIMGHIAHPNCYELPTASPSLVGFAQLAGDLTRTAGGSIRIVRDGRTVQSTFYTSKSSMRLVPGDIVVVDGKVNQGRIIHRGNQSPTDSDGGDVSLAITGVRDYPIVLIVPADRATIRWVTRQLGLDVRVASHVKAITQQQSVPVDPDSRLGTGTVLAFDPSQVDQSRLPDNLPVPVKAGRQAPVAAQLPSPMDPLAQQPLTDQHSGQYGAAPGRAVVPNIGPQSPAYVGPTETLNLPPEEQVFVKRLLTDPDSVPLDDPTPEPQGRAFVSPPMSQQRSISPPAVSSNGSQERAIADAPSNSTGVNEPAGRNSKPAAAVDAVARNTSSGAKAFSPEATRPYQSVPAVPEQLQPFGGARPGSAEVDSESEHSQAEPGAIASSSPGNAAEDSGNGGGFSFALQATGLAGTAAVAGTEQAVDNVGNVALTSAPSSRGAGPTPVMPDGNSLMQAGSTDMTSGSRGSRLLPPPPGGPNWPVVSICVVGLLGAIAASFLIYSIANENPAPRVTKVDTSGRYWLDRMIENDIPIVEETVNYPHNTQLFGKPAPIQRIDAAHNTVPRPHFSAPGGRSGVLKENPATPNAPAPDISDSDQNRIVRIHSGQSSKRQRAAAVPVPHSFSPAAKSRRETSADAVETAVFGDAGQQADSNDSSKVPGDKTPQTGRSLRVDSGIKTVSSTTDKAGRSAFASGKETQSADVDDASSITGPNFLKDHDRSRTAVGRRPVAVQPSPIVVQGANLLDRILSTVDQGQNTARRSFSFRNQDERQSDERGNS